MFQSSKKRMSALLDIVDDMLVGAPEEDLAAPHPHRRPAQVRFERRDGAVAPRPMHCLCPVRPAAGKPATADRDVAR